MLRLIGFLNERPHSEATLESNIKPEHALARYAEYRSREGQRWAKMKKTMASKTIRTSWRAGVVFSIATLALLATAWLTFRGHHYIAGSLLSITGMIAAKGTWEALAASVILKSGEIEFGSVLGRHTIRKEDIESVTWEKGCGVSLKLKDGGWQRVPDLHNAQRVSAGIRAWLKR